MKLFYLLLFLSINTWANTATLKLTGKVYRQSIVKSSKKGTKIILNYNHYLDYVNITGQTHRVFFTANNPVELDSKTIKTITIYSP